MSIIASQPQHLEPSKEVDRWSFVILLLVISVVIFFLSVKLRFYGGLGIAASGVLGAYLSKQPGRIHRNSYPGMVLYKGEADCGFTTTPQKKIDGVAVVKRIANTAHETQIYKTANGTDIVIEANGTVKPCGFGTQLINYFDNAGYLKGILPDGCWKIN
jgi:hypothetical protein